MHRTASALPPAPRIDRWPQAVRSAETLRGTLVRCGPGHRSVGWPETPRIRLLALAPWGAESGIAVLSTAAWVWGALRSPGAVLDFSTDGRRPGKDRIARTRVRQFRCPPEEIVELGGFRVTTPERTLIDLLRYGEEHTPAHRVACRILLGRIEADRVEMRRRISEGRVQYRVRALRRLDGL